MVAWPFDFFFVAKDRSTNMDRTTNAPDVVWVPERTLPADRTSQLAQVLGNLEHNSAMLESMELTLAVALLDHAIAEVRRNIGT